MVIKTFILLLCTLYAHVSISTRPQIVCRDPDVGGTKLNHERKFLVLGAENSGGAGIGNLLIFFPAAFYFAAITGRDIIITDNSVLGGICSIIYCGFPFTSQLSMAFPKIVNPTSLVNAETLRFGDFVKYVEGSKDVSSPVIKAGGFISKSDWWVWFNHTVACVSKLTGCDLGDVMCAERHAYQRLIRGPFKSGFTEKEEKRIRGVPDNLKHALLTLPHAYAPRLDLAIHFRVQFHHFEQQQSTSSQSHQLEVQQWLNSSECHQVFKMMIERTITHIQTNLVKSSTTSSSNSNSNVKPFSITTNELAVMIANAIAATTTAAITTTSSLTDTAPTSSNSNSNNTSLIASQNKNGIRTVRSVKGTSATAATASEATNSNSNINNNNNNPIYIYVAADNEEVKDTFSDLLRYYSKQVFGEAMAMTNILVMQIDANAIAHVKDYHKFQKLTNNEGLLDLVFDWYALSLANNLFAWRKGGTNLLSTFVHSAQKVSGTIERTNNSQGKGIGTRGYQLIRDRRGNLRFELFWGYSFLEDYQKKGNRFLL